MNKYANKLYKNNIIKKETKYEKEQKKYKETGRIPHP